MDLELKPDGFFSVLYVGVDNFFSFRIKFRIVALTILAGCLLIMSCFSDGSWSHSDSTRFGLLDHCFIGPTYTCCESFEDFVGGKPGWLTATLAFTSIGFIFSFFAVLLVICSMCVSYFKTRIHLLLHRLTPGCCLTVALSLIISISVMLNRHHKEAWSKDNNVSRTFYVAVAGVALFVIDALVLFISSTSQNQVHDAIFPPDYWTKFTKDSTIKEWLAKEGHRKVEYINASKAEKEAIMYLIEKTWNPRLAGRGRDALASGYRHMQIMDIERIENPTVYEKYAENRQKLLRRVRQTTLKRLGERLECSDVETEKHIPKNENIFNDLYRDINEHYLFHGTGNAIINRIAEDGFDARLANDGLFGKATYAAECPTKSDQYSDSDSEFYNCKMILLRMLLGDMYVTTTPCPFRRRPPCKQCVENKAEDLVECKHSSHHQRKDWMFDSVVGAIPGKFREFIVYDQHVCYPEYIITYNRV